MKVTKAVAIAVIAMSASVGAGHAQSLSRGEVLPAEFPSASYKGKQYIDSKGCVFIRAGIDGNVTWVPRVNRSRNLICGQTPTQGASTAAAAPAATRAPEQITIAPTPAPAPAPRRVTTAPAPKPAPQAVVRRAPAPTPAPRRVVATAPKPAAAAPVAAPAAKTVPAAKPAPARTATATPRKPACPGASPISARYINSGVRGPVRCGPQAEPIVPNPVVVNRGIAPAASSVRAAPAATVTGQTRVVPKHVYVDRLNTRNIPVPNGYRRAWEDDRLNPNRAEQTLTGHAAMKLIWTSTVPRRLINHVNGADVTATVPLVYPYTDIATQQRELGTVTIERRQGLIVKRIQRNPGTYRAPTVSSRSTPAKAAPVATQQTRATPKAQAPKGERITGKGYVQLGYYDGAASAQQAAQRAMGMGVPARIGTFTRSGQQMRMVLVGPFSTPAAQKSALAKMRSAGFSGAVLR
ncbi:SPOR domain-containing protein [Pseudosulfitobacter koreensis]|uniref:SPOR domain-containing protein n=1 Tax=Pseudosulfitobacter koreensis TaxID=2968472 RepID=A0ABT1YZ93_9RHOB|nr:SPOR domain-containing protein [Pseudosulfitobacter koreense]MCR8826199.1 SPOR domain-containing protein [Pseudosulfitobacter koreense]